MCPVAKPDAQTEAQTEATMSEWTEADMLKLRAKPSERLSVCEHVNTSGACPFDTGVVFNRKRLHALLDALADRDATVKQAHEAHAASFGALATISAALFDGEVDDYDALAQHVINLVADRDATIARLTAELQEIANGG